MNRLSWFLYFTGVADGFSAMLGFLSLVVLFSAFLLLIWYIIIICNPNDRDVRDSEPYFRRTRNLTVLMGIVVVPGWLLMPTRQTLILIAGSEMGERIVKSEQVQGVINPGLVLVQQWIKKESDKLMSETAPKK